MYDNKCFKHPGKLKTHWLGPYVVKEIIDGGAVKLEKLDGMKVRGLVNGIWLKPYFDNCDWVAHIKQKLIMMKDMRREKKFLSQ